MYLALIIKELRLIFRDVYALLVLFVLPIIFVLIMSLSLQDVFQAGLDEDNKPSQIKVFMVFEEEFSESWKASFSKIENLAIDLVKDDLDKIAAAKTQVINSEKMALIYFPASLVKSLQKQEELESPLVFEYSATTPAYLRSLIESSVMKVIAEKQFAVMQALYNPGLGISLSLEDSLGRGVIVRKTLTDSAASIHPSSVQQSVPAWLVFAMFFIIIPLSSTLLIELQQGTLFRLHTYPISLVAILFGKLAPYVGINLVQAFLMFCTGAFIVPLFGGQALQLPKASWLLLPTIFFISLAAISFALVISSLARTHEQASTLGGIGNLIMGALGGVMVPVFIMPEAMQSLASISPMNWGLEALLDVLVRESGFISLGWNWLKLIFFSSTMFFLAAYFLKLRLLKQS